jgi:peroxidase
MAAASVSVQAIVLLAVAAAASAQLSATFYDSSCPRALGTIRSAVTAAVNRDPRMGASLLRLHFHDCFVQASPRLDRRLCRSCMLWRNNNTCS